MLHIKYKSNVKNERCCAHFFIIIDKIMYIIRMLNCIFIYIASYK
jgi:hypothetical protein